MVGVTDRLDGRAVALGGSRTPRRARRRSSPTSADAAALSQRRRARPPLDRADARGRADGARRHLPVQQPQRDRRAGRQSSGRDSSRYRKCPAVPVFARRTIASCTSAWAKRRRVEKIVVRWPSGRRARSPIQPSTRSTRSRSRREHGDPPSPQRRPRRSEANAASGSTAATWRPC